MSRCRCERVEFIVEGQIVEGIVRVDPDCSRHGIPDRRSPWQTWAGLGHLRRHAREITTEVEHVICEGTTAELRWVVTRTRLETPREVEARLLAEARAT